LDLDFLRVKVQGALERLEALIIITIIPTAAITSSTAATALVEVGRVEVEVEVTDSYRGSSPPKSKPHLARVDRTGDPVDLCVIFSYSVVGGEVVGGVEVGRRWQTIRGRRIRMIRWWM
jgi:hypothetical protein